MYSLHWNGRFRCWNAGVWCCVSLRTFSSMTKLHFQLCHSSEFQLWANKRVQSFLKQNSVQIGSLRLSQFRCGMLEEYVNTSRTKVVLIFTSHLPFSKQGGYGCFHLWPHLHCYVTKITIQWLSTATALLGFYWLPRTTTFQQNSCLHLDGLHRPLSVSCCSEIQQKKMLLWPFYDAAMAAEYFLASKWSDRIKRQISFGCVLWPNTEEHIATVPPCCFLFGSAWEHWHLVSDLLNAATKVERQLSVIDLPPVTQRLPGKNLWDVIADSIKALHYSEWQSKLDWLMLDDAIDFLDWNTTELAGYRQQSNQL